MRLPVKRINVLPNPWGIHPHWTKPDDKRLPTAKPHSATMDHEGRPCGVCPMDPIGDGGARGRFVGAKIDDGTTTKADIDQEDEIRSPFQRTVYSYLGTSGHETKPFALAEALAKADPISIPFTQYYQERLLAGELIAADAESAKNAGTSKFFEEPKTLIPKLAQMAAQAFDDQYEEPGAYEHFVRERAEKAAPAKPAPVPEAAAAPAKPTKTSK